MKVSKIPGLGRFGVFIDDVDFNNISTEEWLEIGKIHLNSLVTIIRNTNLTPDVYGPLIGKIGTPRNIAEYTLEKKYKMFFKDILEKVDNNDPFIDDEDKQFIKNSMNIAYISGNNRGIQKVTGKRDENGNPLGMFAEGELLWHSNESGNLCFTPGVALLAHEGVVGSATGFLTTTDWYERQSESFRSELDEMILVHKFTPGRINPGLRSEQDGIMYRNMCPVDGIELPMVINSPAGITGLHYSVNTISHVKGMSQEESDKLFNKINSELFTDEFIYDHWYQNNGDLCLFDNSITLHRRLGGISNRMAYRIQYDFDTILDKPYVPYRQEPFISNYKEQIKDIVTTLNKPKFKLPE